MNGDELFAEDAVLVQKLDRTTFGLGEARLDLRGLLGDVHVQRQGVGKREAPDVREPIGRDRANTVRRYPDPHVVVRCVARDQCLDVGETSLELVVEEAQLRAGRRTTRSVASVDDAQEGDPEAGVLGGTDHGIAHDRTVCVRRSIRLVVHVVELADGQNAGSRELAVREKRDLVDRFGRERRRNAVHRFPPTPKVVRLVRRSSLGEPAHGPLKSVRVSRDECGQLLHQRFMKLEALVVTKNPRGQ